MWTPNHGHTNDLSWFLNLFSSSHLLSWPSFLIQTCCCSGSRLLVILANFKDLDGIASRLRVFHLSTLHPSLQTKKKKKNSERRRYYLADSDMFFLNTFSISHSQEPTFPPYSMLPQIQRILLLSLGMTPPNLSSVEPLCPSSNVLLVTIP